MEAQKYFDAYFALMESGELLRDVVEHQLKVEAGLTYVQFRILAILSEAEDRSLRMTNLADSIVYSRSGVTYQTTQLEKRGLIKRATALDDERGVTVSMTPEGARVLADVVPAHIQHVYDALFSKLTLDQVDSMIETLGTVRGHLRAGSARSSRLK